jgi:hypothetical protein
MDYRLSVDRQHLLQVSAFSEGRRGMRERRSRHRWFDGSYITVDFGNIAFVGARLARQRHRCPLNRVCAG